MAWAWGSGKASWRRLEEARWKFKSRDPSPVSVMEGEATALWKHRLARLFIATRGSMVVSPELGLERGVEAAYRESPPGTGKEGRLPRAGTKHTG